MLLGQSGYGDSREDALLETAGLAGEHSARVLVCPCDIGDAVAVAAGCRLQVKFKVPTAGQSLSAAAPAHAAVPAKLRAKSFTIDGEAAVCGPDGIAIFDALHRRGTVTEAMLFAFDLL